VKDERLD